MKGYSTLNKKQLQQSLDTVITRKTYDRAVDMLKSYKLVELREMAKSADVKGYYKLNKVELYQELCKKYKLCQQVGGNQRYVTLQLDIVKLYRFLEYNYEVCGHFVKDSKKSNLIPRLTNKGYQEEKRKACNPQYRTSVVWHTHPNGEQGYPVWKISIVSLNIHLYLLSQLTGVYGNYFLKNLIQLI